MINVSNVTLSFTCFISLQLDIQRARKRSFTVLKARNPELLGEAAFDRGGDDD